MLIDREKRVKNIRRGRVFYTLLECSLNIVTRALLLHKYTRQVLHFSFNHISKSYYVVNNFTIKIDFAVLLDWTR